LSQELIVNISNKTNHVLLSIAKILSTKIGNSHGCSSTHYGFGFFSQYAGKSQKISRIFHGASTMHLINCLMIEEQDVFHLFEDCSQKKLFKTK